LLDNSRQEGYGLGNGSSGWMMPKANSKEKNIPKEKEKQVQGKGDQSLLTTD